MVIRLCVRVSERGLPAVITVRDAFRRLVFFKTTRKSKNALRFCACGKIIIVTVRPIDEKYGAVTKVIRLTEGSCGIFGLSFEFEKTSSKKQHFYLSDKNYGFPVAEALLKFFGARR